MNCAHVRARPLSNAAQWCPECGAKRTIRLLLLTLQGERATWGPWVKPKPRAPKRPKRNSSSSSRQGQFDY